MKQIIISAATIWVITILSQSCERDVVQTKYDTITNTNFDTITKTNYDTTIIVKNDTLKVTMAPNYNFGLAIQIQLPTCTNCGEGTPPSDSLDVNGGPAIALSGIIVGLKPGITISSYSWQQTDPTYTNVSDSTGFFKYAIDGYGGHVFADSAVYSLATLVIGNTYYYKLIVTDNKNDTVISRVQTRIYGL